MGMINWVMGSDSSIIDASKNGSSGPYTSGAVYWDSGSNQFKVVDSNGGTYPIPGETVNINVGSKLREMITWYETEKFKEANRKAAIEKLCEEYPNLKDALADINKAQENFEVLYNLLKDR